MPFSLFSTSHISAIFILCVSVAILWYMKNQLKVVRNVGVIEKSFAITLVIADMGYYLWLIFTDRWNIQDSLPLELCSISLVLAVILLWTGNRHLYDIVFYAGIGGALQAIITPVLDIDFPHFRYFHFFFTHIGIIVTAMYFTWVKDYRPTFKGILKTMLILNLLLPGIFIINRLTEGNYMFLQRKPTNGSLLDFLGPYPWYILSLEGVAFLTFSILWLIFRKRK